MFPHLSTFIFISNMDGDWRWSASTVAVGENCFVGEAVIRENTPAALSNDKSKRIASYSEEKYVWLVCDGVEEHTVA